MSSFSRLLFSYRGAERHPFGLFLWGFIYASLSLLISLWLLPENASMIMIFFTLISCMYVVQKILIHEELYEKNLFSEFKILKKHGKALTCFLALFIGFLLAFSFWSAVLPEHLFNVAFKEQTRTIEGIRAITGNSVSSQPIFGLIFVNNIKVVLLSLIFAVFYGAGSIFILAWNSSVMGAVIGSILRSLDSVLLLPVAFVKYLLHGVPEMLAYLTAALAGGIMFITFMKGDFEKEQLKRTSLDVFVLLVISFALLFVAAIIEVYISARI